MTNADKMRSMQIEEMAEIIARCPYVGRFPRPCEERAVDCKECTLKWLTEEVDEPKPEPKKPSVPKPIDRPNFESQLTSYSIKAFVHQFKYLACKINEIITYLEEQNNDGT